jgi:predicted AAA+ superfamily ATPase
MDTELATLFAELPAIAIEGARGVGKTSTARRLARQTLRLDVPETAASIMSDPVALDRAARPLLLDEWQRVPTVWDQVRRHVDDDNGPGQFLLTGSAIPPEAPVHTGAGRIVRLRMRPLSLAERGLGSPTVSLRGLLDDPPNKVHGITDVQLHDYVDEIIMSGFPGIRSMGQRGRAAELDGYIDNIINRDFKLQGLAVRQPEVVRQWLRAYGLATGTTASYTTILDAATRGDDDKPAKNTTASYRAVLDSLWLTDDIPAWLPLGGRLGKLFKGSKHYLVDPALAVRLARLTDQQLLFGITARAAKQVVDSPVAGAAHTLLGRLFESLVASTLATYVQGADADLYHFRTSTGNHEVDFIVDRFPEILAIEVKLASMVTDSDVRHLNWLEAKLPEAHVTKVVVTTGQFALTRPDGVHLVPAALLGP